MNVTILSGRVESKLFKAIALAQDSMDILRHTVFAVCHWTALAWKENPASAGKVLLAEDASMVRAGKRSPGSDGASTMDVELNRASGATN